LIATIFFKKAFSVFVSSVIVFVQITKSSLAGNPMLNFQKEALKDEGLNFNARHGFPVNCETPGYVLFFFTRKK
jgi:hypothetical protein